MLLPLILFQAAGFRRPIKSEKAIGLPFGLGLGVLYSVTTISGPPLALLLNNQGLDKREFRAALGFIRLAESSFTAIAYLAAGLITTQSNLLIPQILPSVLIGVPIGAALIRQMKVETFRRICMSFDAWIVGFGVSTVLQDINVVQGAGGLPVPGGRHRHRWGPALPFFFGTRADLTWLGRAEHNERVTCLSCESGVRPARVVAHVHGANPCALDFLFRLLIVRSTAN